MRCTVAFAICLFAFTMNTVICAEPSTEEAEKKAVDSAEAWLSLIDKQKFGDGWENAAAFLKNAVSKDAFEKSLTAARSPLGAVKSRKVKSKQYTKTLPGAPDGEYVVIQFDTSFENKKSAIETITPMLEKNGKWSVSGYFIK